MKDLDFLTRNIIAHRGFFNNKDGIPENSILAFEKAIQSNFMIELDVHLLKDNKIVVFHDDNLKRMTGLDKEIKDCTYSEIEKLRLLDTEQKIPLFEEVLELVSGKVPILIELKYDVKVGLLENEIKKLLENYNGKCAVQSFSPNTVYWFKKNAPEVVRGQLSCAFDKKKMNKISKFALSNLVFNIFTKPDFVSYNIHSVEKILSKIGRNMILLGWTVKTKQEYEKYVEICDNLICENLNFLNINACKNKKYGI